MRLEKVNLKCVLDGGRLEERKKNEKKNVWESMQMKRVI